MRCTQNEGFELNHFFVLLSASKRPFYALFSTYCMHVFLFFVVKVWSRACVHVGHYPVHFIGSLLFVKQGKEQTGIDELMLNDLICITDHCYIREGKWHLKHTWWYDMLYTNPTDLTPQTEEDITKAAWVAKSSLTPFLLNTYPSIVEVFREAKI